MEIHLLSDNTGKVRLFQEMSELGYVVVKVPEVGAIVRYINEKPDKAYRILNVTVYGDESGFNANVTLLPIDPEGQDIGEESETTAISNIETI